MAVRIRADRETIVCAAMSDAKPGDCYLDDDVHQTLFVDLGMMRCLGAGGGSWEFCAPGARFKSKEGWMEEFKVIVGIVILSFSLWVYLVKPLARTVSAYLKEEGR